MSHRLFSPTEAAQHQLTNDERLIKPVTSGVTMATQTLDTSMASVRSGELSVEEVDDDDEEEELALDNDVISTRPFNPDTRGTMQSPVEGMVNPGFDDNDAGITYSTKYPAGKMCQPFGTSEVLQRQQENKEKTLNTPRDVPETPGPIMVKQKTAIFKDEVITQDTRQPPETEAQVLIDIVNYREPDQHELQRNIHGKVLSPRSEFILRADTPHSSKINSQDESEAVPSLDVHKAEVKAPPPCDEDIPQTPRTPRDSTIHEKINKRQKKIGALLKDLVTSSSVSTNNNTEDMPERPATPEPEPLDGEDVESQDVSRTTRPRQQKPQGDLPPPPPHPSKTKTLLVSPRSIVKNAMAKKVKHTPVKSYNENNEPAFPYSNDLVNFHTPRQGPGTPRMAPGLTEDALEKYGARKKKNKTTKASRGEDMLFIPRLNLANIEPDRNCFSDQDIADSDITDLETEPENNAVSDTEGITTSRLIAISTTGRNISGNSLDNMPYSTSDSDAELGIIDYDVLEAKYTRAKKPPSILPGARGAQELRGHSGKKRSAYARDYIPANERRKGSHQNNDSRRRYLALNSLRRKAYKLSLQNQEDRGDRRPESAELMSYHTRAATATLTLLSTV